MECGKDGDCGYCSIAVGTNNLNKKNPRQDALTHSDFRPKGPFQAALRLEAAKELSSHPQRYADFLTDAELSTKRQEIITAGNDIDSVALHALSTASNTTFHIWAYDAKLTRWVFYVIKPAAKSNKPAKTITDVPFFVFSSTGSKL